MRRLLLTLLGLLVAAPILADEDLPEKVREHVANARAQLQQRHPQLDTPLDRLDRAARHLDESLSMMDRHLAATHRFLQEIGPCPDFPKELSSSDRQGLPDRDEVTRELRQTPERVEEAFDDLRAAREALKDALPKVPDEKTPAGFLDEAQRAIDAADEILVRRRDAMRNATWLQRFEEKRRRIANESFPCEALQDIFPLPAPVSWSELRKDPLRPVKQLHERHEQAVARRYRALQEGDWGIGIGMIYTPLDAPRWGTIPDPANSGQRIITRVHEETRAGQPVLMAHFRPPEGSFPFRHSIRPYLEFGAGLEFDEPSFFIGGAIDLGPYLRVGIGATAQQVEELTDGQEEGMSIPAFVPIRTEDSFDGDIYVAVTINIEQWLFRD